MEHPRSTAPSRAPGTRGWAGGTGTAASQPCQLLSPGRRLPGSRERRRWLGEGQGTSLPPAPPPAAPCCPASNLQSGHSGRGGGAPPLLLQAGVQPPTAWHRPRAWQAPSAQLPLLSSGTRGWGSSLVGRAPEPPLGPRLSRSRTPRMGGGQLAQGHGETGPDPVMGGHIHCEGPGIRQHPDPTQHCPTLGARKHWGLGRAPSVGSRVDLTCGAGPWWEVPQSCRPPQGPKGRTPTARGLGSKGCLPFPSQSPIQQGSPQAPP